MVSGDDDAFEQVGWQLGGQFRGERRAAEDPEAWYARVDDRGAGELPGADGRADAVGADQDVALRRGAVGERRRYLSWRFLVAGDRLAGAERVTQPGPQDRAQRPAVHTGMRPVPLVGRAQVRLGAELVELVVQDDRLAPVVGPAGGLRVQLEQVGGQAAAERLAAVGVHVQVVADLAAIVGVALEDLAGVPVLEQALGQGQAGQAAAGDEDVQPFRGHEPSIS